MSKDKAIEIIKPAALPATLDMFEADAGCGFEDAGREAFAIPFLKILQSGSPQCKKSEAEYVKGAAEGDFFNTVTEKLYTNEGGGLNFVPCYYRRVWNLWAQKADGGGFRGSLPSSEGESMLLNCQRIEKVGDVTPDGLILIDNREHYGLVVEDDGSVVPVLLSLSSTQVKYSKKWMSFMQSLKLPNGKEAPMMSQMYNLTTVGQSNDEGTWSVIKVNHVGYVPNAEVYEKAKAFRDAVRSGEAEAKEPLPF